MKTPYRTTFIEKLPTRRYRLAGRIEVHIFKEPDGGFRATAPELGMWMDGLGWTEAEAIKELGDAIVGQRDSVNKEGQVNWSQYAKKVRTLFERRVLQT
jgi:hypothetical protein